MLDDEAERTDVDVASGQLRAQRVNDGLGGLARRAVADAGSSILTGQSARSAGRGPPFAGHDRRRPQLSHTLNLPDDRRNRGNRVVKSRGRLNALRAQQIRAEQIRQAGESNADTA